MTVSKAFPWIAGLLAAVTVILVFEPRQGLEHVEEARAFPDSNGPTVVDLGEAGSQPDDLPESGGTQVPGSMNEDVATPEVGELQGPSTLDRYRQLAERFAEGDEILTSDLESVFRRSPDLRESKVQYLVDAGLSVQDAERIADDVAVRTAECKKALPRSLADAQRITNGTTNAGQLRKLFYDAQNCELSVLHNAGLAGWLAARQNSPAQ
jgi:hypothetical protein